jgi:hypothetical protein
LQQAGFASSAGQTKKQARPILMDGLV